MGFSLIQWGLALLFFSLNLGGVISYAIGSHAIETTLGLSSAQIGSLGGSYFIAYAISQLLLGSLFGLVPSRWLLGGSALLAGLGALVMDSPLFSWRGAYSPRRWAKPWRPCR
jgi:sugar phosphate permease